MYIIFRGNFNDIFIARDPWDVRSRALSHNRHLIVKELNGIINLGDSYYLSFYRRELVIYC